jgi:DNA-binding beta-propeller fold protein YncE
VKQQVIRIPNTFMGMVWDPSGERFYVAGGVNDNVHVYARNGLSWTESGTPIPLGHSSGLGLDTAAMAAGLAVNPDGTRLLVANMENDSVSLIDLQQRMVVAERDLRPGKNNAARSGVAGGEFPLWVVFQGDSKAYVSSLRDREIVVMDVRNDQLRIARRIGVSGSPNRMLLDRAQGRLFVALDNSDSVAIIDTRSDRVEREIDVNAQFKRSKGKLRFTGSHPNSLALAPDESLLFVTMGGTNSVAVVPLGEGEDEEDEEENETESKGKGKSRDRIGLIPTGWYPNSVSVSADGRHLYIVNSLAPAGATNLTDRNQYVLQKRHAGFLTVPLPSPRVMADLTRQVLFNNGAEAKDIHGKDATMAFLSKKIKHVIYIIKENRTYDQVLGDLNRGNGDPSLTMFPEPITPNHRALARNLMLIELPRDHTGDFGEALDDTDTPDEQVADNDYALGLIVEKVAQSPYKDDTLIFVIEDDAQAGPDHVDTQRTVSYVLGPYVKQGAVVSQHYANPNILRTIADILKMEPMGLQVALADPMSEVFDRSQRDWSYRAIVPEILRQTQLPLPSPNTANSLPPTDWTRRFSVSRGDAKYWTKAMEGQDFKREDHLDTERFNRALWSGLMGDDVPYPTERHGRDLSRNRSALLRRARAAQGSKSVASDLAATINHTLAVCN